MSAERLNVRRSRLWGLPSVCLAAASLGLWLLWPKVGGPARRWTPPVARVAFVRIPFGEDTLHMKPELFGLPSRVGFNAGEGGPMGDIPEVAPRERARAPRLLATTTAAQPVERVWLGGAPAAAAQRSLRGYRVTPGTRGHAPVAVTGEVRVVVHASPALARLGFRLPAEALEKLVSTHKEWQVDAFVTVDAEGHVVHAFLDGGGADVETSAEALRAIHRGVLEPGQGPCEGYVSVWRGESP